VTPRTQRAASARLCLFLIALAACDQDTPAADDAASSGDGGVEVHADPGAKLQLAPAPSAQAELDKLRAELAKLEGLSATALLSQHPMQYTESLGYDPRSAKNLDLIQASALKLNDAELSKLGQQGFVITPRNQYPHMLYGYQTIYAADLPVFISLDSILDAVHVSYDRILSQLESEHLTAELRALFASARARVKDAGLDASVARDLDLYFSVASSLLEGSAQAPQFAENTSSVAKVLALADAADRIEKVSLFGVTRDYDASQFKPRGHYVDTPELSQYFRAMMWLGRTDFRLIETQPDGSALFRRRQVEAVLALTAVVKDAGRAAFDRIDQAVSAFVGEHDYMQLSEADQLSADLGGLVGAKQRSDAEIAQLIVDKGYGAQRISSQVVYTNESSGAPLPLSRSFALLGQRYVVDSHVFSNVVFDRVPRNAAGELRGMPNPLDAAYAAFDNPAALPLLESELTRYGYAPQLESIHSLVAAHESDYWDENLYNLWLSALRAASPKQGAQNPAAEGMPAVTGTEAWQRRLLNTQLASWAQLRRDTILYVKQSYSGGAICEFPDGYVDPYPAAFARLEKFAMKGSSIAALFQGGSADGVRMYFENMAQVTAILRTMAESEKSGLPFNAEQLAFLNDAVRIQVGGVCGGPPTYEGWYTRLLYGKRGEINPAIADVHTDPSDVPHVLHVATGLPRMMVMTRDTCMGPRAYVGLAFAYHEVIKALPRLSDQDWAPLAAKAEDVAFMKPILP
jgi:Protein of unknown function (DUF3160)